MLFDGLYIEKYLNCLQFGTLLIYYKLKSRSIIIFYFEFFKNLFEKSH
jgi:hypothetical protein